MMRTLMLAIGMLLATSAARAQSTIIVGPNSSLAWDIAAPDVATANSLTYAATIDGGAPKTLAPVACVSTPLPAGSFLCTTPIAQIPTGSHAITLTAASGAIISLPSTVFAYVDMIIPIPQNVRIR